MFVILFIGLSYVAQLAETHESVQMEARACAWLYSANNCTAIPPGCEGFLRVGTASGGLDNAVNDALDRGRNDVLNTASSGGSNNSIPGGKVVSDILGTLFESAIQDTFGRSLEAAVSNDLHPPEPIGDPKMTATVSGKYHLACNLKPTTLGDVAKNAWHKLIPW